jgi:cysteine desulfurase/selenocysteine lyase
VLKVMPIDDAARSTWRPSAGLLGPRTKLVAMTRALERPRHRQRRWPRSSALARTTPARSCSSTARRPAHLAVDVQALGCDFYAFSGHKLYGPTGIGVLYGREALLDAMPPWQGGGDMIASVTFEKSTWNTLPYKFEAGTPHIEGASASARPPAT